MMKAFSTFGLLLAVYIADTAAEDSDTVYCLTKEDCKQKKEELGFSTFKSKDYGKYGRGCFSKGEALYWGTGGTYERKTEMNMRDGRERVTCEEAKQTSSPSSQPTDKPVDETVFLPVLDSEIIESNNKTGTWLELSANETEHDESLAGSNTVTEDEVTKNVDVNSVKEEEEDEVEDDYDEKKGDGNEEEDVAGEEDTVTSQYLVESEKQQDASGRILQIGVAVLSVGVLAVAAYVHRSRQRRNDDATAAAVATIPSLSTGSYDIEHGRSSDNELPKNTVDVFQAETEEVDNGSWAPASYDQSASLDSASTGASGSEDGDTESMWEDIRGIVSQYTDVDDKSVKTSKISNIST
jgi:hypothetical protein